MCYFQIYKILENKEKTNILENGWVNIGLGRIQK